MICQHQRVATVHINAHHIKKDTKSHKDTHMNTSRPQGWLFVVTEWAHTLAHEHPCKFNVLLLHHILKSPNDLYVFLHLTQRLALSQLNESFTNGDSVCTHHRMNLFLEDILLVQLVKQLFEPGLCDLVCKVLHTNIQI